jgi:hypothetical protein
MFVPPERAEPKAQNGTKVVKITNTNPPPKSQILRSPGGASNAVRSQAGAWEREETVALNAYSSVDLLNRQVAPRFSPRRANKLG